MNIGMGMQEIFIILLAIFGGGMGLPVGLPPGPEDPMMFKVAPEECVYYATWTGIAKLEPQANPTEAWMGQPEMVAMTNKLRAAWRGSVETKAKSISDPAGAAFTRFMLELADVAISSPTAVWMTDFEIINDAPVIAGAALISLGDETDRIEAALEKFSAELAKIDSKKFGIEAVEVEGQPAFRLTLPENASEVYLALRGKYFAISIGKQSLIDIAKNSQTDAPKWLTDFRSELAVERFASMSYVNTKLAIKKFPVDADRDIEKMLEMTNRLFGDDLQSMAWVSGVDSHGFLNRVSLRTAEKPSGILSVIDRGPIPQAWISDIPTDSIIAVASRLSGSEILRIVKEIASDMGSEEEMTEVMKQFQTVTGMSLEDEFIETLSDFIYFYYQYDAEKPFNGIMASIRIEDEMSFPAIYEQINKGIERLLGDQGMPGLKKQAIDDQEIITVGDGRMGMVSWALAENEWLFGYEGSDIARHLRGPAEGKRLTDQASINLLYQFGEEQKFGGPIVVSHLNLKSLLEIVWPLFGALINEDEKVAPDFDFTWGDIPDLKVLTNDMQPSVSAVYRTPTGFQMLVRQTYPGASPLATIAGIGTLAAPYAAAEFEAAKVVANKNKLRQLGLAALNFDNAFGKLPAAYSVDHTGKQLLSWRVHLLPYLDENELYEQFHLDEPWDSDHNRALIKKMPDVFKNSAIETPTGKTVFLAVSGKDRVFTEPAEPKKTFSNRKFADIRDGMSNTVMMVEVSDEHAVTWTQPEDFSGDGASLLEKTKGIRANNEILLIMTDCSVRIIPALDAEDIEALLGINDGQVVEIP